MSDNAYMSVANYNSFVQFCITLAASISLSLSIVPRNPRTRHPCPDKMYPQQRVAAAAVTGYDRRLPLVPAIIWRSCISNWLLAIMVLRSAGVRLPPALTCECKHHDGEALHPPHDDLKVRRISRLDNGGHCSIIIIHKNYMKMVSLAFTLSLHVLHFNDNIKSQVGMLWTWCIYDK